MTKHVGKNKLFLYILFFLYHQPNKNMNHSILYTTNQTQIFVSRNVLYPLFL
jgi:hypothetical protein